jgi:hypothetical protein
MNASVRHTGVGTELGSVPDRRATSATHRAAGDLLVASQGTSSRGVPAPKLAGDADGARAAGRADAEEERHRADRQARS